MVFSASLLLTAFPAMHVSLVQSRVHIHLTITCVSPDIHVIYATGHKTSIHHHYHNKAEL